MAFYNWVIYKCNTFLFRSLCFSFVLLFPFLSFFLSIFLLLLSSAIRTNFLLTWSLCLYSNIITCNIVVHIWINILCDYKIVLNTRNIAHFYVQYVIVNVIRYCFIRDIMYVSSFIYKHFHNICSCVFLYFCRLDVYIQETLS